MFHAEAAQAISLELSLRVFAILSGCEAQPAVFVEGFLQPLASFTMAAALGAGWWPVWGDTEFYEAKVGVHLGVYIFDPGGIQALHAFAGREVSR